MQGSPTRQITGLSPDEDVALCNDVRAAGGFPQLCISEDFIAVQARVFCNILVFVGVIGAGVGDLWERGLPAKNDDVVYLTDRGA
jgi:hypothetical protein